MSEQTEARQRVDELLNQIQAGAEAGGAKEYVQKYIKAAKQDVFRMLVDTKPDLTNLLRVWAWAIGIDHMEHDLKLAIEKGVSARSELENEAPGEPGQA